MSEDGQAAGGSFGREKQKNRTRLALLRSATELVRQGRTPSVTEVADAAEISRRTAYRYFPGQEKMLSEVALEQLRPAMKDVLAAAARATDSQQALDRFVAGLQKLTIQHETLLRAMIRISLEEQPDGHPTPSRGYRRIEWIETVLSPLRARMPRAAFDRLVSALAVCTGLDAHVVLRDIRGLEPPACVRVCRWMAGVLLQAALRETN